MRALQVVTQYPLQSKAFTWLLSALYLLSCTPYSALHTLTGSVPVALFPTIVSDDKTIKSHYKPSNTLPLNPHGYWASGHSLFNLNTQITAANDNEWRLAA